MPVRFLSSSVKFLSPTPFTKVTMNDMEYCIDVTVHRNRSEIQTWTITSVLIVLTITSPNKEEEKFQNYFVFHHGTQREKVLHVKVFMCLLYGVSVFLSTVSCLPDNAKCLESQQQPKQFTH